MKLYTREQMIEAFNYGKTLKGFDWIGDMIDSLDVIELPSDEEIEEYFKHGWGSDNHGSYAIFGAKWLKDKILGGNK